MTLMARDGEQVNTGALALRILDWDLRFEVNSNKREFRLGDTKKRLKPLEFIRKPAGTSRTEDDMEILAVAGSENACRVKGFYFDLAGIAAGKEREYRGWILNRRLVPMGPYEIAAVLGYPPEQVAGDLDILRNCHLVEWRNCAFAVECGQPVRLDVSDGGARDKENLAKFSEISEGLKQNQTLNLTEQTGSAKEDDTRGRSGGAAATPGPTGRRGDDLRGFPPGFPEDLGLGDLKGSETGGGGPEGGKPGEKRAADEGDLEFGDLARETGREGVRDTGNGTPETPNKNILSGGPLGLLPVSWNDVLKRVKALGQLEQESPEIMLDNLSDKNELIRREQLINRAWIWIKKLFPEQLDPDPAAPEKHLQAARGRETTFLRRLTDLWEKEREDGLIEIVRFCQQKRIEAARPRSRIIDPVAIVVSQLNRRTGRYRIRNKEPPENGGPEKES